MAEESRVCCEKDNLPQNKLKILAIHGYRQNAEVFKQKTGSFRKLVHKWAQFSYITAPHKVLVVDGGDAKNGEARDLEQYGWFFNRDDNTFRGIREGGPAIGFDESLQYMQKVFETEGPFDGIFGFSQGACFAGLLCDLQERGLLPFKFKFAILSSGFKSRSLPHLKYFEKPIFIPSLHIYGENDELIPTAMSAEFAHCFDNPLVQIHSGGHYLPASAAEKHNYQAFFYKMARKYKKQE